MKAVIASVSVTLIIMIEALAAVGHIQMKVPLPWVLFGFLAHQVQPIQLMVVAGCLLVLAEIKIALSPLMIKQL